MKTTFYLFLFVILCLPVTTTSAQAVAESNWIDGYWSGTKYQTNISTGWVTELTIDSKNNSYRISYPELNCSGDLELVNMEEGRAVFIEKIGGGPCITDGYIIITYVNEKLISFTCLRDEEQRLASFSTLQKREF